MQIPQPKIDNATDDLCFACGKDNPIGLKVQFTEDGGIVRGEFTPGKLHQGWQGITHGGILCTLLDEAGGYAVINAGLDCVTAKSEIRFANLAPIDEPIQISAQITKKTSRLVETEATLSLKNSTVIAKSASLWYLVRRAKDTD